MVAIATIAGLSLAGICLPRVGTLDTNTLLALGGGAASIIILDSIAVGVRHSRPASKAPNIEQEKILVKTQSKEEILQDIKMEKNPPEFDLIKSSKKVPHHTIVNGLSLGASKAFAQSVNLPVFGHDDMGVPFQLDTSNKEGFNAVVTVCPLMSIDGDYDGFEKYSKEQVGEAFSKANITWSDVGQLAGDDPIFWEGLVHDCTRPGSELAAKKRVSKRP